MGRTTLCLQTDGQGDSIIPPPPTYTSFVCDKNVSKIAHKKTWLFSLDQQGNFHLVHALVCIVFNALSKKKIICLCIYIPDSKSFKSESAIDSSLINISFPVKHVDKCKYRTMFNENQFFFTSIDSRKNSENFFM